MPRRKLKIHFEDGDGSTYAVTVTGNLAREKVLKILDLMDTIDTKSSYPEILPSKDSLFGRLYGLIEEGFPLGSFDSADLLEAYEDQFNEPISLSTVSTYLSRMSDRGLLSRTKINSSWNYRHVRVGVKR